MYMDPRHDFPVFLFTEQSQVVPDASRHPEIPRPVYREDSQRFIQARDFVDSLLSSK